MAKAKRPLRGGFRAVEADTAATDGQQGRSPAAPLAVSSAWHISAQLAGLSPLGPAAEHAQLLQRLRQPQPQPQPCSLLTAHSSREEAAQPATQGGVRQLRIQPAHHMPEHPPSTRLHHRPPSTSPSSRAAQRTHPQHPTLPSRHQLHRTQRTNGSLAAPLSFPSASASPLPSPPPPSSAAALSHVVVEAM